jgi:hypothetical protein
MELRLEHMKSVRWARVALTEIGGLGNKGIGGQYFAGLQPDGFAALGDKVFISALDTDDYRGLWVTDGTASGTIEIGGLKNAGIRGASKISFMPSLFFTSYFTSFGNKLLFNAVGSTAADTGLWVTDGTAAGTTSISSLDGNYFTAFGSKVVYPGLAVC